MDGVPTDSSAPVDTHFPAYLNSIIEVLRSVIHCVYFIHCEWFLADALFACVSVM